MTTQETLSDFVCSVTADKIDPLALERAKATIIDCLGVAIAGSLTPLAEKMRAYLRATGELSPKASTILLGSSERSSAPSAALYNGTISHALDYDDDNHPAGIHLSASLLPSLLSVSSDRELLSEDFCCAYVIGYEIAGKLGHILSWYRRGRPWHPTCMIGVIGCTAAISRMLGFDRLATSNALGIAASCAAGLRANGGTETKPFHAGRAAQGAVTAALLAREGFESSSDAFDGGSGYFQAFRVPDTNGFESDVANALESLGDPWEICTDIGIHLKPWPSCSASHPAIEAALNIASKVDYQSIDNIYIGTCAISPDLLVQHSPDKALEGKFSVEYCVAAALRWGAVTIDTFTDERVRDADIRELMRKMNVQIDDRVRSSVERAVVIRATLRSGEVIEEIVEMAKGKGDRWMTMDEQAEKFEDCVSRALGQDRATAMFNELYGKGGVSLYDWTPELIGR